MSHYNRRRATSVGTLPWNANMWNKMSDKGGHVCLHTSKQSPGWKFQAWNNLCSDWSWLLFWLAINSNCDATSPWAAVRSGKRTQRCRRRAPNCVRWCYVCFDLTLFGRNENMWRRGSIYKCLQMLKASRTKHTHTHSSYLGSHFESSYSCLDGGLKHLESFQKLAWIWMDCISVKCIPLSKW